MRTNDERRWHYRVQYPDRAMPSLDVPFGKARVIDVSEGGMRFDMPAGTDTPRFEDEFEGTLRFHDGRTVKVRAIVTRAQGRHVCCRLHPPGIPLNVMFDEQRWLMQRYPARFRAAS